MLISKTLTRSSRLKIFVMNCFNLFFSYLQKKDHMMWRFNLKPLFKKKKDVEILSTQSSSFVLSQSRKRVAETV